jgi:hypothetical protein
MFASERYNNFARRTPRARFTAARTPDGLHSPKTLTTAMKPTARADKISVARTLAGRAAAAALALALAAGAALAQADAGGVRGQVTDALGGAVVGAVVTLVEAHGRELESVTDAEGRYAFDALAPGAYLLRAKAEGFAAYESPRLEVHAGRHAVHDIRLRVALAAEAVTVGAEARPGVEPEGNLSALVLRGEDILLLANSPGGLAAALQAITQPAAGPNGAQLYVDGFGSRHLPPVESIREIRINQNPFAAEYARPGSGRIEIITKPGTEQLHAVAFLDFNDESLNARDAFAPRRDPAQTRLFGGSLSGPLRRNRASFFVSFERHEAEVSGNVNATVLNNAWQVERLNESVPSPSARTDFGARFDLKLNGTHTATARFALYAAGRRNEGVGGLSLPSRALRSSAAESTFQLTETAVLGKTIVNEIRLLYVGADERRSGDNSSPGIEVPGAFVGGGAQSGPTAVGRDLFELHNYTTLTAGQHQLKFGAQLRASKIRDESSQNFGGTFSFAGGLGPQLDADGRVVRDEEGRPVVVPVNSLERYRRTLVFAGQGLSPAEVRARGGGATQFSIAAGEPEASVGQFEAGAFVQDDWRLRPNLMLSLGLRYEAQTNIGSPLNFAPRVAFAWSPDASGGKSATVLRGGFGLFYERFGETLTLKARRFDGVRQRQFITTDASVLDLFPRAPSPDTLTEFAVPSAVRRVAADLRAPYLVQASVSLERQLPAGFTLSVSYRHARALHTLRSRNVNAPAADGARPFGGVGDIFEYESSGRAAQNQLSTNVVSRLGKVLTFYASHVWSSDRSDTDGPESFPLNSHDVRSEYGRSALDIRHQFYVGGWVRAPWGVDLSTLIFVRSGLPFNITTGRDLNGDNLFTERPAFAASLDRPGVVRTRFGAFDLDPAPGQELIPRNFGVGPKFFSVGVGASKAFTLRREAGGAGGRAERFYQLVLSLRFENLFNRTNAGLPVGDLSSPLFGQSYASAGAFGVGSGAVGSRRVAVQAAIKF